MMKAVDEEVFQGGVNSVRRIGSTVVRPAGDHTPTVHRLLRHLRHTGFDLAPEVLGLDDREGTETLSFLSGDVGNHPVHSSFWGDEVLESAASLLRDYHDATVGFVREADDRWFLPATEPAEVICHGDFATYNCVLVDGRVSGMFDFDTAHPGPRFSDLGYASFRWVPLNCPANAELRQDIDEQARRLRLFCDAYGEADREAVVRSAIERLRALVELMRRLAGEGDEAFGRHIAEGHDDRYLADIRFMSDNIDELAGSVPRD